MKRNQTQWNDTKNNEELDRLRIGYYCCEWGINIRGKIDCDKLAEYVKNLDDDIIISKKNAFLWTDAAQNEIIEDIEEKDLNRIVASAWTPRTHEPIYRDSISKTELNPYYFQMVNIREHCSWVTEEKEDAFEKAKILVKSGIARAKYVFYCMVKFFRSSSYHNCTGLKSDSNSRRWNRRYECCARFGKSGN